MREDANGVKLCGLASRWFCKLWKYETWDLLLCLKFIFQVWHLWGTMPLFYTIDILCLEGEPCRSEKKRPLTLRCRWTVCVLSWSTPVLSHASVGRLSLSFVEVLTFLAAQNCEQQSLCWVVLSSGWINFCLKALLVWNAPGCCVWRKSFFQILLRYME